MIHALCVSAVAAQSATIKSRDIYGPALRLAGANRVSGWTDKKPLQFFLQPLGHSMQRRWVSMA